MVRILAALIPFLSVTLMVSAQGNQQKVYTSDIDNFWKAYDSIRTTDDRDKQLHFIRALYIDKGTEGLKAFMEARDYTAELWVQLINAYPKFWNSVRPNTLTVKSKAREIEKSIQRLKALYPDLREARMYFAIGGLNSGGTTQEDRVLIGTEIATGDATTDVSEFPDKWLAGVFQKHQTDNIIPLNIHEYVHTQQKGEAQNLLARAINEGACDFITELVMNTPLSNNYLQYGREHEKDLKEQFKQEMFTTAYSNWLYNGTKATTVADLGYFMGYTICHAYYSNSPNKTQAIKDIIELNYSDSSAVEHFLSRSKYFTEQIDKAALIKRFEERRPYVKELYPFSSGDTLVDAAIKELKILFSVPMNTKGYSINLGERGKEFSPVAGVAGFSNDGTSFTLKLDMKPAHDYEFVITGNGFKSAEGYPLKPYLVRFKTR